jgi:hypothetical protein
VWLGAAYAEQSTKTRVKIFYRETSDSNFLKYLAIHKPSYAIASFYNSVGYAHKQVNSDFRAC